MLSLTPNLLNAPYIKCNEGYKLSIKNRNAMKRCYDDKYKNKQKLNVTLLRPRLIPISLKMRFFLSYFQSHIIH